MGSGILLLSLMIAIALTLLPLPSESGCHIGCDLAFASYYVSPNLNLTYISGIFGLTYDQIIPITNKDSILFGSRVNVNFPCDFIHSDFLGHNFNYTTVSGDTYDHVASTVFANLTTANRLAQLNTYPPTNPIPANTTINVTINCSCGNSSVSEDYGLFVTYPLRSGENLSSVAAAFGFSSDEGLLQRYNPRVNFSAEKEIVFIPTRGSKDSSSSEPQGLWGSGIPAWDLEGKLDYHYRFLGHIFDVGQKVAIHDTSQSQLVKQSIQRAADLERERDEARRSFAEFERERDEARRSFAEFDRKSLDLERERDDLQNRFDESERQRQKALKDLTHSNKELGIASQAEKDLTDQVAQLKIDVREKKKKVITAHDLFKKLKEKMKKLKQKDKVQSPPHP